jgi:nitroimidazol reductase NimA-like FMN-containing flavoprotein (pyridoxamine 5'-phosphate oxidase superfamily)
MGSTYKPTERTQVRRKRDRGRYERELVHRILDEALICHVGFVTDGQPYVIPTIHARDGETLYLHGSPANRTMGALSEGAPLCVTVTLIDELVLARSARQHSLNYRSVVLFGSAREVTDPAEKEQALQAVVEHMVPGRSAEIRGPDAKELETTKVVALSIEEASAKVREDPPVDKRRDLSSESWAGLLPLAVAPGEPIPSENVPPDLPVPEHVRNWSRSAGD